MTDWADERAENMLLCRCGHNGYERESGRHFDDCPASNRPAVAAELRRVVEECVLSFARTRDVAAILAKFPEVTP